MRTLSTERFEDENLSRIARVLAVRFCRGPSGMNEVLGRLCSLAGQLEGLGLLRTADDLRCVVDELRGDPDVRLGPAIERLKMVASRLARGGDGRSAREVRCLVDDLLGLRGVAPIP
jgi:hypothetical protein